MTAKQKAGFVSLIVSEKADYAIITIGRDVFELSLVDFSIALADPPPKPPRLQGKHSRGLACVSVPTVTLALTGAIVNQKRRARGRGRRKS